MAQSEVLSSFYREYLNWVETGGEDTRIFGGRDGLCICFENYLLSKGYNRKSILMHSLELTQQFRDANLDIHYPFNSGDGDGDGVSDSDHYANEKYKHKNPLRIKWVRDHV
jgi:hypothetical protein